jgi:hypothetical protein
MCVRPRERPAIDVQVYRGTRSGAALQWSLLQAGAQVIPGKPCDRQANPLLPQRPIARPSSRRGERLEIMPNGTGGSPADGR